MTHTEATAETTAEHIPLYINEPPLPAGAQPATGEWGGWFDPPGESFRFLVTEEKHVGRHHVIGFVTQEQDGRCGEQRVYLDGECGIHNGFLPDEARRFAYAILDAADQVDRWAGDKPNNHVTHGDCPACRFEAGEADD